MLKLNHKRNDAPNGAFFISGDSRVTHFFKKSLILFFLARKGLLHMAIPVKQNRQRRKPNKLIAMRNKHFSYFESFKKY